MFGNRVFIDATRSERGGFGWELAQYADVIRRGGIWMQLCTLIVMKRRYSNCFYKPGVPKIDRKWPKASGKGGVDMLTALRNNLSLTPQLLILFSSLAPVR